MIAYIRIFLFLLQILLFEIILVSVMFLIRLCYFIQVFIIVFKLRDGNFLSHK